MPQNPNNPPAERLRVLDLIHALRRYRGDDAQLVDAGFDLLEVVTLVTRVIEEFFAKQPISRGGFKVLAALANEGAPITPSTLATRCAVSRATITGLLDTLDSDGLLRREKLGVDRRSIDVVLTPLGEAKFRDYLNGFLGVMTGLTAGLTAEERVLVSRASKAIVRRAT